MSHIIFSYLLVLYLFVCIIKKIKYFLLVTNFEAKALSDCFNYPFNLFLPNDHVIFHPSLHIASQEKSFIVKNSKVELHVVRLKMNVVPD